MKKWLILSLLVSTARMAHAVAITNISFNTTNITHETGLPNSTTISFTIDAPGQVQIGVSRVVNSGDPGTQVAVLDQTFAGAGAQTMVWDALWLINGDVGRHNGNYSFTFLFTAAGGTASTTPSTLVQINSVDIHGMVATPSFDVNNTPTFPYLVAYALAKDARVTVTICNSSGTVVRTLISNKLQLGESSVAGHVLSWDGLGNDGLPAPIGIYTAKVNATDPVTGDAAIERQRSLTVDSLAGSASNAQKLFEDNVFVYPNPVRNGQGTFQMQAIRDGANLSLKIYTINGTLVREESFPNVTTGNIQTFNWLADNQSGQKVGRGLYYYVVREDDAAGTLQAVKKLVVIP